jgi:HSP20 family protein
MARRGNDLPALRGTVERMPRMMSPFGDMDRLFDEFFGRRWPAALSTGAASEYAPSVDVIDRDDEVFVRAQVPGFRKEDIEISVSGDVLTLSGTTSSEQKEEKGNFYRCEISSGAFTRTIALPANVDETKAKATMKEGVLELTLPKIEKSKRRNITIS